MDLLCHGCCVVLIVDTVIQNLQANFCKQPSVLLLLEHACCGFPAAGAWLGPSLGEGFCGGTARGVAFLSLPFCVNE